MKKAADNGRNKIAKRRPERELKKRVDRASKEVSRVYNEWAKAAKEHCS